MANRDPAVFGHFANDFHEFLAAFLAQLRKEDADRIALDGRREAEIAFLDRFFDWMHRVHVPRLNRQGAGLRSGNTSELSNAHIRPVNLYHDVLVQSWGSFPGAYV